jgi:hypothetical protein
MRSAGNGDVDRIVRLHHRRRGWAWVGFGSLIGLVAYVIIGVALFANLTGTAATVSVVPLFVLLVLMVVGLITALVDTVRLRGFGAEARRSARESVSHYPVYGHAHGYPPRHHLSWIAALLMLLAMAGVTVIFLPEEVNSIAYVAGLESQDTFHPLDYTQDCGRGGCTTVTEGFLSNSGANVTWGSQVPLDQSFPVRVPVWDWGTGRTLSDGDGGAIAGIVIGLVFNVFTVLLLFALIVIPRTMRSLRRQTGTAIAGGQASYKHQWTPDKAQHGHYEVMPPASGDIGSGHEGHGRESLDEDPS